MKNFIENNKGTLITVGAVVAVIVVILIGFVSVYSNAVGYREEVTNAKSAIKVQEKRRAELLPTLADAIKAYDKHEAETLLSVVEARTSKDGTISDDAQKEINNAIDVIVEKYPELKSQDNYKQFMKESSTTENLIAETRNAYNNAVGRYNKYTDHPLRRIAFFVTGFQVEKYEKLDFEVSQDAPKNLFD